jgi:hypothetical protein
MNNKEHKAAKKPSITEFHARLIKMDVIGHECAKKSPKKEKKLKK